jgi:hypothetical protein
MRLSRCIILVGTKELNLTDAIEVKVILYFEIECKVQCKDEGPCNVTAIRCNVSRGAKTGCKDWVQRRRDRMSVTAIRCEVSRGAKTGCKDWVQRRRDRMNVTAIRCEVSRGAKTGCKDEGISSCDCNPMRGKKRRNSRVRRLGAKRMRPQQYDWSMMRFGKKCSEEVQSQGTKTEGRIMRLRRDAIQEEGWRKGTTWCKDMRGRGSQTGDRRQEKKQSRGD